MKQYICVGPTDPGHNQMAGIHECWHEQYADRADAYWVWQSFRLCRQTPRKIILSYAVTMTLALTFVESVIALSRDTASPIDFHGVRLVRRCSVSA